MLEEFFVDNYKSLINVTFCPKQQNLLLGMNNSGKTNLCQAMMFLAMTARHQLDDCANTVAGPAYAVPNFYFDKPTIEFRVKVKLPFEHDWLDFRYGLIVAFRKSDRNSVPTLEVVKETLEATGGGLHDTLLLENTSAGVRLLHERDYLDGKAHYVSTTAPRDATMLNRLYALDTNERANLFKSYLGFCQYYSLSSEMLRGANRRPHDLLLHPDGGNLASVIYRLKTSDERSYRALLHHLQRIDPRIDLINFVLPSEDTVFMFFEDRAGHRLPASSASNGTMRFLALIYVLMGQPVGELFPLVVIEEPEDGIYVGFLRDLLEIAESARQPSQLIYTTHSPYFIDLFDDRLDGIFLIKGGKEHSILTQPDPKGTKHNLETFSLGEQHFREMLK